MNKARLERLAQQFLPSTNDDGFAPLWWSKWCAGFCSAVDEDMGRSPVVTLSTFRPLGFTTLS
jgi:hypothetical protein